jgi:hypothetical protein
LVNEAMEIRQPLVGVYDAFELASGPNMANRIDFSAGRHH